jgi:protein RecA
MAKKEKNKKLDNILKKYEKKYEMERASDVKIPPKLKTKWFTLDYILDGGIAQAPGGHLIEFHGKESSGKTTSALKVIARYQELDKVCALISVEGYDAMWGEINGINNKELLLIKPTEQETAGEAILDLIKDDVDLIVIDSLAMLSPKAEIEKSLDEKTRGEQAQVNTVLCRKINRIKKLSNTTIIFINQVRDNQSPYGDPIRIPGGHSLSHLYDTRVRFKPGQPIEIGSGDKKERIGFEMDIWCKKNKMGTPYRRAKCDFYLNGQIDNEKTLLIQAIKYGIIEQSGKWLTYKEKRYDGKKNFRKALNKKDWDEIEEEIWKRIK